MPKFRDITWPIEIGPFTIYPDRGRSKDQHTGRFGGGWNYRIGITASSRSRITGQLTILVGLWSREYRVVHTATKRRGHRGPR